MEPYEELGVTSTASSAEIRRAYVRLARRFHPDHRGDDPAGARRMADINAAWTVLGDERRRAAYDATRAAEVTAPRATVRDAGDTWTPLDDGPDDPVTLDDTPTGARPVPRLVAMAPALLLTSGIVAALVGSMTGMGGLAGVGLLAVAAGAVAFVAIPVVAMINASRTERDW